MNRGRYYLIIVFFILSNQLLFAQEMRQAAPGGGRNRSNLIGKISDAVTGEPIAGASVYFSDIKAGGVSNDAGLYKLQNFPSGRYLIEVSHLGYASVIEQVELRGDQVKDFQLRPSIVENDEV